MFEFLLMLATSFGWIFFIVFFFIGLFMMIRAQLKYNGGII